MYRPVPLTARSSVPPSPVVVEKIVVQAAASLDTWIWYARPKAASHVSVTWLIAYAWPRSIRIHCGSLKPLDQRVPALPSTALAGPSEAFSLDDEAAGLLRAMLAPPPPPPV